MCQGVPAPFIQGIWGPWVPERRPSLPPSSPLFEFTPPPHTHTHNHSQNITKCVIRWLQISERTNAGNDFKFPLNCPGFDPVSFFFFFTSKIRGKFFLKNKKENRQLKPDILSFFFCSFHFFFFCFSKKFILLPSKQAE